VVYHEDMVLWPDRGIEARSCSILTDDRNEGETRRPAIPQARRATCDAAARAMLEAGGLQVIPDRVGPLTSGD
jgi:hypothetical protein